MAERKGRDLDNVNNLIKKLSTIDLGFSIVTWNYKPAGTTLIHTVSYLDLSMRDKIKQSDLNINELSPWFFLYQGFYNTELGLEYGTLSLLSEGR